MGRSQKQRQRRRVIWVRAIGVALLVLVGAWWTFRRSGDVVARVLFSETAGCSAGERLLVAGVMQNRVGHPAFGRCPTLQAVARQPGAFSCVDDPDNRNWGKTARPGQMTRAERAIWEECLRIARSNISAARGPSGRLLVYYHDKSIHTPASWNNERWRAVFELATAHFVFYSIVPASGRDP